MSKKLFEEYIELKKQEAFIKEQLAVKKDEVAQALKMTEGEIYTNGENKITLRSNVTYQYSDVIANLEETLNETKKSITKMKGDERKNGTATVVEGSETFTPVFS